MQEIKKVGPMSLAKIFSLLGILTGLLQGIYILGLRERYSAEGVDISFSGAIQYISQDPTVGIVPLLVALGWWNLVVSPILFGAVYFVSGIVSGCLFNWFAKLVGGVKVEISAHK
jgi:hypothetical protein